MQETTITSLNEFVQFIQSNCGLGSVYRGCRDKYYTLIPSLGRVNNPSKTEEENLETIYKDERNCMRMFKTHAYQFHKNFSIPDIELLAMAQHHGLRTRLLDWTRSALVSLYFAVEEDSTKTDSVVYIFNNEDKVGFIDGEKAWTINPYKVEKNLFFIPLNSTPRVTAQQGLFLLFTNPMQPFTSDNLKKLIIPESNKYRIKFELAMLGINKSVLYPDIDGLTSYLNWAIFK